jgi:hypothetical protein
MPVYQDSENRYHFCWGHYLSVEEDYLGPDHVRVSRELDEGKFSQGS